MKSDGTLTELSQSSDLVAALAGRTKGDQRFFFPREMLLRNATENDTLFAEQIELFNHFIHNGAIQENN